MAKPGKVGKGGTSSKMGKRKDKKEGGRMSKKVHPEKLKNIMKAKEAKKNSRRMTNRSEKKKEKRGLLRQKEAQRAYQAKIDEDVEYQKKLQIELAGGNDPRSNHQVKVMDKRELQALVQSQKRVLLDEMEDELAKEDVRVGRTAAIEPDPLSQYKSVEDEPRSFEKNPIPSWVRTMLPIKNQQGGIVARYLAVDDKKKEKKGEEEEEDEDSDDESSDDEELRVGTKSYVQILVERKRKIDQKKLEIAALATAIIGEPEEKIKLLKNLEAYLKEEDPDIAITVRKYAALSMFEVFNHLIPTFELGEETKDHKSLLRKEKKQAYKFEDDLLFEYKQYLITLEANLKDKKLQNEHSKEAFNQLMIAILKCYGELLLRKGHFNYTFNIVQVITPYGSYKVKEVAQVVLDTFKKLFIRDKTGEMTLEIVMQMDKYIRRKFFKVEPYYIQAFLDINISNVKNLDALIEAHRNASKKLTHTQKLIKKVIEERAPKKSIKERKKCKKQRILEEKMREFKDIRSNRKRQEAHSKILQIVFGIYIHVLKRKPNKVLNEVVLEGLAKFAHLINIEFFGDLLDVLGQKMLEGTMNFRESMFCIKTVFTILSGQGEALTLDPRQFFTYLYANMLKMGQDGNQSNVFPTLDALKMMLVHRQRCVNSERSLAFAKRLATLSLAQPFHNNIIASLSVLRGIVLNNPNTKFLLDSDTEGTSGIFQPEVKEPEHCNAGATAFFEYRLLSRHYHNFVQKMTHHLVNSAPLHGEGSLPIDMTRKTLQELQDMFDPQEMCFNPTVPKPELHLPKKDERKMTSKKNRRARFITPYMQKQMEELVTDENRNRLLGHEASGMGHPNGHAANGISGVNGTKKQDEENGMDADTSEEAMISDADFFKGMIWNMDLASIPSRQNTNGEPEGRWDKDVTLELVKVEAK
ncbi:nucleolar complex protein 3 homolog [Penaeus vannamei]|uniref:nucleolar complex protein 3 homolog n=1 Tax=Penaeus vannamei TaxID=6689 RepID=UPI00387F88C2